MADFDQFANQGGPAAWDPDNADDSRKLADELLGKSGTRSTPATGKKVTDDEADDLVAEDTGSDDAGADELDDEREQA